ncbi:MAG TPA: M20 family metallopeptidase [Alphaproteobacteria bacterium]|nr:M20 family metallopeptidase [Alphaproteobacteria bacterium]
MELAPDPTRMQRRLEQLVALNTENPPGREAEAAGYLAEILREIGLATEVHEVEPGRSNVIGRLENGVGPVFAFNSHIDVVPAGDGWSSPPFTLSERSGRLYGRGSCDAKGPIVAMIEAIEMLMHDRRHWTGTLIAAFVADEEVESRGAKAYVKGRPHIDYAVIGEPTSNIPVTAHKGSLRPIVRVSGQTAHSGTPDLGVNAILKAARLLTTIEAHHRIVAERRHPLVGSASMTVTRISGGHADNVVPDRCEFMIDRRMVPGEDEAAVIAEIEELLTRAKIEHRVDATITSFKPTTGGATETATDHPVVRAALKASATHGVADPRPAGFQGGCDLVHFRSVGAQGVVLGPGSLAVAHKPDEFVPRDEFINASLIYRDIARSMLHEHGATR